MTKYYYAETFQTFYWLSCVHRAAKGAFKPSFYSTGEGFWLPESQKNLIFVKWKQRYNTRKIWIVVLPPRPTAHNPRPTTHNPQPTTHNPQPTTKKGHSTSFQPKFRKVHAPWSQFFYSPAQRSWDRGSLVLGSVSTCVRMWQKTCGFWLNVIHISPMTTSSKLCPLLTNICRLMDFEAGL